MEMEALKFIGAGLTAFGMLGAAIGVGTVFSAALNGISRNPSAKKDLIVNAFIGAALAEAMGLLAFVVGLMILQ
ncbi:MAG: atpE [Rickettsiales bacterium]|jgi:F-type H+-transporting ATPase subunit c|nr:atpE [Rickettsiales bacterium]